MSNDPGRVQIVSRRGFIGTVFTAGALVLGAEFLTRSGHSAQSAGSAEPWYPDVYLGIQPDGTVVIVAHRSEMGTGIRTALPMVAADELGVDFGKVRIEQGLADKKYGSQDTDGSNSIVGFYEPLRRAGATARTMLIGAAGAKWGLPAADITVANGQVMHAPSGKRAGFSELVAAAARQPVPKPADLKFKSPAEWRYIGKGVPIVDLDKFVSGTSVFGIDAKMPGMVYASIERPPVLGGKVASSDDSEALKVRGVRRTVKIDLYKGPYAFQPLGGVAVIADNTWGDAGAQEAEDRLGSGGERKIRF